MHKTTLKNYFLYVFWLVFVQAVLKKEKRIPREAAKWAAIAKMSRCINLFAGKYDTKKKKIKSKTLN